MMTLFWDLCIKIGSDLLEIVVYIPSGLLAGCLLAVIGQIVKEKRKLWLFFFGCYAAIALQVALFSREPGSRMGCDLELFATWGRKALPNAYFVENILFFIPLGILLPLGFQRCHRIIFCALCAFFLSASLELIQLLTQRGYCQLDDVVTNVLGAAIGWLIWRIMDRR